MPDTNKFGIDAIKETGFKATEGFTFNLVAYKVSLIELVETLPTISV